MAQRHKSAQKRARQNITRNRRNRVIKSHIRVALKDVQTNTDAALGPKLAVTAQRVLDRAAGKRVLHKNKAARLKSQVMRKKPASAKPDATT